jgi:hypothetical protein
MYTSLIPALNAPIVLNADGTLTDFSVEYFRTLAEKNLIQMRRDQEISTDPDIEIDTTQDVLQTGLLIISADIQPVGVARNIRVNLGFNVSIA